MNFHAKPRRGRHLVASGRAVGEGVGAAWLARLMPTRLFDRVLDRIDVGLEQGSLEAHLPDGRVRLMGGRNPGPDVVVYLYHWRALARLAVGGSVGWYRAWARGEWTSPDPVALFELFMRNARTLGKTARARGPARWVARAVHALSRNSLTGARRNIVAHYDLGNDFYAAWLDPAMVYSSGKTDGAPFDLVESQGRKIDAILDRLPLRSGARLLEIGSGWGALGLRAVQRHDVLYRGITLSDEQAAHCNALFGEVGVSRQAQVAITDYRVVEGQYDAIASVEMVEAVGQQYWPDFLDTVAARLNPGGRAAIQFIAIDDALFDAYAASSDFIQVHVFPGGCLISESRFRALAEERGLTWSDYDRFGLDYAETLKAWRDRFDAALADGRILGFDPDFIALWRYYLMYCEGGFRSGGIWVAQATLTRDA